LKNCRRAWCQGLDVDVVEAVPRGPDVVEVGGTEVGIDAPGTVEVDTEDVDRGFVDADVEDRSVDEVERGALVGVGAGSVVDVVSGTVVRGVTVPTKPDCGTPSGRTSRNSASVTTKIPLSISVDRRARPSISWRPAARCWSRDRGR
jgi:hypothetical protein